MTEQEIEIMDIVDIETICQRIRQLQVQTVARASCRASLSEIWSIVRERLAEACRMREVHTELRLEHEVLVKSKFGKDSREQFVFLVSQRIVRQPLQRILARALPCTVIDRCQGSVRLVRVPVWLHETCCRNRGHQSICSFISLKNVLVVEHGVCSHLEPSGHLLFEVEAHRITGELRAWSNTLLVIITA